MTDFGDVVLSLWPDLVTLIGGLVCGLIIIRAIALAGRAVRAWQRQRRIEDLDLAATRAMDLGGHVHPPHDAHITDRTPTEAIEVTPRDFDGLGDVDPDWRLGDPR